jgi:glycosyltransferase involved in cell wall biosynthesis
VDNNEARQNLIEEGLKYASNYTQEKYAERFLKIMEDEL